MSTGRRCSTASHACRPRCLAGDYAGNIFDSTDPTGGAGAWTMTHVDGPNAVDTYYQNALTSIACASPTLCIAVDGSGNEIVATSPTLTVTLAGSGSGSVSGSGIACPGSCSSNYVPGTSVPLTATPAAGSVFAGWTGACSGIGACDVTLNSDTTVTATFSPKPPPKRPPAPNTRITKSKASSAKRSASFSFTGSGAVTSFQCALVRRREPTRARKHPKQPTPTYATCHSPASYKHLASASYTFFVRAVGPGGSDPTPATEQFKIG
jgi:hypothetical protein